MADKKLPLRKCVGCGEMKPKDELFRLVKIDKNVLVDLTMKLDGRGAYVCKSEACINTASKKKSFNRALRCPVSEEVINKLLMECKNGG